MIPSKLFVAKKNLKIIKLLGENIEVFPAFMVPEDSKNFVESAKKWGNNYCVINNIPVSGIRIVNLDKRSNGGRAYKIIYPPNYLVDMREDVLLDVIFNEGIEKGGFVRGDFVWAVNKSQMKLVRKNSSLYDEFNLRSKIAKSVLISNKDLKKNGIYLCKDGSISLYLGEVSTIHFNRYLKVYQNHKDTKIRINDKKGSLWFFPYHKKFDVDNVVNKVKHRLEHHIYNNRNGSFDVLKVKVVKCLGHLDDMYSVEFIKNGIYNRITNNNNNGLTDKLIYDVCLDSTILNAVDIKENPMNSLCYEMIELLNYQ